MTSRLFIIDQSQASLVMLIRAFLSASLLLAVLQASAAEIVRGGLIQLENIPAEVEAYVDGVLVNEFVVREGDYLLVRLPFPDSSRPFTLMLRDPASGAVLLEQDYRVATAVDVFDTVETTSNVQIDGVASRLGTPTPSPGAFDRFEEQVGSLGRFGVAATRDDWGLRVDAELTGTSEPFQRLRGPEGSAVDLSRGVATASFSSETRRTDLSLGDINVPGRHALVASGIASRGIAVSTRFGEAGVSINAGQVSGTDIVGFTRGPVGVRSRSYRRLIDIGWQVRSNVELLASWLDAERPSDFNFNTAEVVDGETNRVYGVGTRFRLLEDRLSLEGFWARSRYDNPADLNFFNDPDNVFQVPASEDRALQGRLDASLFSGEVWQAQASAEFNRAGPFFRSIAAGVAPDRENRAYSIALSHPDGRVSLFHRSFRNNVDDFAGVLTTRQESAGVDGEYYMAGDDAPPWMPESVSAGFSRDTVRTLNGETVGESSSLNGSELPRQETLSANVGGRWPLSQGEIGLLVSWSHLDTQQVGRESADTRDVGVELNYSLFGDVWSLNGRLGWGAFRNFDVNSSTDEDRVEIGVSGRLEIPDWPSVDLSVDRNRTDSLFVTFNELAINKGYSVSLGVDLSTVIAPWFGEMAPTLRLNYQLTSNTSIDAFSTFIGRDSSVILSFGVQL